MVNTWIDYLYVVGLHKSIRFCVSLSGCGINRLPIDEISGQLAWSSGDVNRTVKVPIHWEYVNDSAQLHVEIHLEAWKMGRIENYDIIIARIYGVSKGACPSGNEVVSQTY